MVELGSDLMMPSLHGPSFGITVSSTQGLRTGGCWFESPARPLLFEIL